jgi:two-component system phosphate regulon sensor histidine kinase PhoR
MVVWYLTSHLSSIVRQRDRQLIVVNERLLAAGRERTQHMLHTTHELKAPFAAIQSYVQLLTKGYCGELSDDSREVLGKIDARSQRLSNQIREMLQLANLRSAAGVRPSEQMDVTELVSRAITSNQAQAQARNISFSTNLHQASVYGVADQLEMMLANILANAVQYSRPAGTVTVSSGQLEDGSARVQIVDNGIGIREDALNRIFEEYYRTKEAAKYNPRSTGLGLAIVKHIIQSHRICLCIDSQLGQGTSFTLTFPLVERTHSHLDNPAER